MNPFLRTMFPRLQGSVKCSMKVLGSPLSCPAWVLRSCRSCAKKPSAGVGMRWPPHAAVQHSLCCGWRSHRRSSPCKLIPSVVLLARQACRNGPWSCLAVQEYPSSPTSLLLAPDIRSWTLFRMTSFSLATISKGNNVHGVGFCSFSGMLRTAIFMPVLTLERWWTGSRAISWWQKKGTSTLLCCTTVTKWWTPLPPQNGSLGQKELCFHEV